MLIEISKTKISQYNKRKSMHPESIGEMAKSLKSIGLLQPVVAIQTNDGWDVLAGARRLTAAKHLNWKQIEANAIPIDTAIEVQKAIAYSENLHREDLTVEDEMEQAKDLAQKGCSIENISIIMAKPVNWVRARLQLSNLSADWKKVMKKNAGRADLNLQYFIEICRLPKSLQGDLYDEWGHEEDFDVDHAKARIKKLAKLIKTAPWPKTFKSADFPTCAECPERSGAQGELFVDPDFMAKNDRCLNSHCWEKKEKAYLLSRIERITKKQEGDVLVYAPWDKQNALEQLDDNVRIAGNPYDHLTKHTPAENDPHKKALVVEFDGTIKEIRVPILDSISKSENKEKTFEEKANALFAKRYKRAAEMLNELFSKDNGEVFKQILDSLTIDHMATLLCLFGPGSFVDDDRTYSQNLEWIQNQLTDLELTKLPEETTYTSERELAPWLVEKSNLQMTFCTVFLRPLFTQNNIKCSWAKGMLHQAACILQSEDFINHVEDALKKAFEEIKIPKSWISQPDYDLSVIDKYQEEYFNIFGEVQSETK